MKRKMMVLLLAMGLTATLPIGHMFAQEKKVKASVGADLGSSYIWRGMDCGGVSIQPGMSIETPCGLSFGTWGSVGLEKTDTKELDLYVGYSVGDFSVTVTDYWFSVYDAENKYFKYASGETAHVYEATLAYDFGTFSLACNTNFAGSDYYAKDGDRSYSTYIEATVPFTVGDLDMTFEIGGTPAEGMYSDGANITNIGLGASKSISVTDKLKLPAFAKVTLNPYTDKAYLTFGLSF